MTLEAFLRQFGSGLGSGVSIAGLAVIFVAGILASAVCPCTLPVGLGMAGAAGASESHNRRSGLKIATAFFAGIVVNLTLLGALAGRLGALATEQFGTYWALGMTVLSLAAAMLAFRGVRLNETQLEGWRRSGFVGAFGYGFVFSLGTSVAPLLLLLTVSAAKASPLEGLLLAFAFGAGRGLPFLVAGVLASAAAGFTRLASWRRSIQLVSGSALLVVSGYYANTFLALQ